MSDIVERLEHYAKRAMPHYPNDLCSEAKREIEQLRAASHAQKAADCGEYMPLALLPLEDPSHDPGEHQVVDADTAYVFKIVGDRDRAERVIAALNAGATPLIPAEGERKFEGDRVTILQDDFESLCADRRELSRLRDTIDLLERNARIQAKLLADTGRERNQARAQVERETWRPIETAPKDKVILLCVAGYQPAAGRWWPVDSCWTSFDWEGHFESDAEVTAYVNGVSYEPTHWKPLPAGPSLTSTMCTCGGDLGQPASDHDISCPAALPPTLTERSDG